MPAATNTVLIYQPREREAKEKKKAAKRSSEDAFCKEYSRLLRQEYQWLPACSRATQCLETNEDHRWLFNVYDTGYMPRRLPSVPNFHLCKDCSEEMYPPTPLLSTKSLSHTSHLLSKASGLHFEPVSTTTLLCQTR